jgi:hypothetical protein
MASRTPHSTDTAKTEMAIEEFWVVSTCCTVNHPPAETCKGYTAFRDSIAAEEIRPVMPNADHP